MKLSIIVINYKSQDFIQKCIKSIYFDQDYEIIIVDNENNQKLMDLLSKISNVKIIAFAGNLGFSKGNNRGIEVSKGDYILTLNADVFLNKDYIIKCIDFLDHNLQFSSVQGKLILYNNKNLIDSTGNVITRSRLAYNRDHKNKDYSIESGEIFGVCAAAAVYRKTALKKIKINNEYFDNDFFAYLEDVDLDWRLRLKGYNAYFLNTTAAFHIRESTTASKFRFKQALRNRLYLIIKNDNKLSLIFNMLFYSPILLLLPQRVNNIKLIYKMIKKRKIIQNNSKLTLHQITALFKKTPWIFYLKKLLLSNKS